ncbi:hypothetical protein LIER_36367 [Lithospermum erythrorhizon]|uniref:WAT1-related protein n=1 Tax=Lithospermum erythrorhizon TaxID=34254 RepID=A0AAV3P9D6_LITER
MERSKLISHARIYLAVMFLQFGRAGNAIIAKAALNGGMSHYALTVYRNLIAAVVFAPFALFFERKIRPEMTLSIMFKIMLLGLIEPVIDQNLYYAGMKYTTATFTTAMCNILPALTFLFAWLFRLEDVSIRSLYSQMKILGTIVTLGGAMIMSLIGGPIIAFPWTKPESHVHSPSSDTHGHDSLKGTIMIVASCVCWASFYILQAITLKSYPAGLSLTTLICFSGALQGSALTLVVERGNAAIWALHWDLNLLAYVYSGIICSGVSYYISGMIMEVKGPVFVTAFSPLTMVIVAIMSSLFLAEHLTLGQLLGAVIIVVGLYAVVWGKSRDLKSSTSSCDKRELEDHKRTTSIYVDEEAKNTSNLKHTEITNMKSGESQV